MARKERYLVGLDVGTSKIAAIVGEMTDDGGLDIIGLGLAESKGIRRGVVVNLEAAVESIKKAIDEAELTAGVEIDSVHLGLSGAHVERSLFVFDPERAFQYDGDFFELRPLARLFPAGR